MGEENQRSKDADVITLWVMRGPTAEPAQYRIDLAVMRRYAIIAGAALLSIVLIFVVVIPSFLFSYRAKYRELKNENAVLTEAAYQSICSAEQLQDLSGELGTLENRVGLACKNARTILGGMEKDLNRWIPEGAAGGAETKADKKEKTPTIKLTPSQIAQVHELKSRMNVLNDQLKSYEDTVSEINRGWNKRNALFAALPSMWPVHEGWITSEFGMRFHPISKTYQMHEGIDIAANQGTKIYAVAPGTVAFAGWQNGYGNAVMIDHGYNLSSFYGHCHALFVVPGQKVKKGDVIAEVGTTGNSTGPHLHFEVRIRGIQVDPMQYLSVFSPRPSP